MSPPPRTAGLLPMTGPFLHRHRRPGSLGARPLRRAWPLAAALFAVLLAPASALAHPLGNLSVNHLAELRVAPDRVEVRYVLDQAEIPTFQERSLTLAEILRR